MAEVKPAIETFAKIKVVGIGGSGGSAVNRMVAGKIQGVEFAAVNTDIQALQHSLAGKKIHIGKDTTRGLGAGMDPEVGQRAAEESQSEITELLKGADMVFLTCGLGGGTGSGASPVVAEMARNLGALTVAVVTKPFAFEGAIRRQIADKALDQLTSRVDAIITIPNDKILQVVDKKTSLLNAFQIADEILKNGVQGISELITVPGLINVDFADVKAIMKDTGSALMGIGHGKGDNRAIDAAQMAIESPLLEVAIDGAKGILFTITGGPDMSMHEVNEAAKIVTESADPNAKIIFGAVINEDFGDEVKITVVATGFGKKTPTRRESFYVPAAAHSPATSSRLMSAVAVEPEDDYDARRTQERVQEEEERVRMQQKAAGEDRRRATTTKTSAAPEAQDELDIPAFIRKKML